MADAAPLSVVTIFSEDKTALQSTYTFPASGTWTPNANEIVVIAVGLRKGVGPTTTPTIGGTGGWSILWTNLERVDTTGSTTTTVTVFTGFPTSETPGTIIVEAIVNHAQCGIVVFSLANSDYTKSGLTTFTDGSTDGSVGIVGYSDPFDDLGYMLFSVCRGTPSAFVPASAQVHDTTVTGGVMGITGAWLDGKTDVPHFGDFTSGTNTATVLVELPLTGMGMTAGLTRNMLVF